MNYIYRCCGTGFIFIGLHVTGYECIVIGKLPKAIVMGQQKLLTELSSYYTVLSFELILVNFYLMLFHALYSLCQKQ
jgi:hypothetical protein